MSDVPFGVCCRHHYRAILFPWVFIDGESGWACRDCIVKDMRSRNENKNAKKT